MIFSKHYDVIVIGGGHAGTEAALAAARIGCQTLLLTHNIETLGQMSCNPSIGGIGKGHLVKEVDALGGLMARAADLGGIQFRILNSSKGPAVRATRAQADRILYKQAVRSTLENQKNLDLFQQAAADLVVQGDRISGVITELGIQFNGTCVVLTAGTFLGGKIHVGLENTQGGRAGDPASVKLSERLKELNLGRAGSKPARRHALMVAVLTLAASPSSRATLIPYLFSHSWGAPNNIRAKCRAGSRIPMKKPTTLFVKAWIAHRCTPA